MLLIIFCRNATILRGWTHSTCCWADFSWSSSTLVTIHGLTLSYHSTANTRSPWPLFHSLWSLLLLVWVVSSSAHLLTPLCHQPPLSRTSKVIVRLLLHRPLSQMLSRNINSLRIRLLLILTSSSRRAQSTFNTRSLILQSQCSHLLGRLHLLKNNRCCMRYSLLKSL